MVSATRILNRTPRRALRFTEVDQFRFLEDLCRKSSTNYVWALEGNLAVRVDAEAPGQSRFPSLVVGATISLPNVRVAEEAVILMRSALSIGLEPGVNDADKQYWANSIPDRLHTLAIAAGFTPSTDYSTDYRVDRLSVQGGAHGALFIEGGVYCPGTPKALQNASINFVDSGKADPETYRVRIEARKAFQLHQKEKPDAKGRVMLRCPALGPSPTVTCPPRELLKTVTPKQRPGVDQADVPDFPDKICRQHSVSFKTADLQRQAQAFEYGSEEWEEFHKQRPQLDRVAELPSDSRRQRRHPIRREAAGPGAGGSPGRHHDAAHQLQHRQDSQIHQRQDQRRRQKPDHRPRA